MIRLGTMRERRFSRDAIRSCLAGIFLFLALVDTSLAAQQLPKVNPVKQKPSSRQEKRWLFFWREMTNPVEVDRMIARFPRAQAAGYNGVVFPHKIPASKAAELKEAAKRHGLDLIAVVMGRPHDLNYIEGVPVKDALYVARSGTATFQPDTPTRLTNGDFEDVSGSRFKGWSLQDDEGVTTFADHDVFHSGKTSLRMENIGRNADRRCRIGQPIKLQPYRQYHVSVWVKSEDLRPTDPEIKVQVPGPQPDLSFQTIRVERTQDWQKYDIVFNSFQHREAWLYFGSWQGRSGKIWVDDLRVEEIGLVNVLRRPGCPVTVRSEGGTEYEEGRDYEKIADPLLNPRVAYHEPTPKIRLMSNTRVREGERLRVSYYHPLVIYENRVTECLSEPQLLADWRSEVKQASALYNPSAFLLARDELRVMNQCALCRSRKLTPAQILADNIRKATQIVRDVRPDAEIWVWSDMFDPMHNAVDHFYFVNGSLKGSWEGLARDVGIVSWHGDLMGKNSPFFAERGLRQILAGYYDRDEKGTAIVRWQENTKDVRGIVGAMYTTWEDKYDAMETWAKQAWGDGKTSPAAK